MTTATIQQAEDAFGPYPASSSLRFGAAEDTALDPGGTFRFTAPGRGHGRTQTELHGIARAMEAKAEREERLAAVHAAYWQMGRLAETPAQIYLQTCAHRGWNWNSRGVDAGILMAEERRQLVGYLTPWGGWVRGGWVMGRTNAERATFGFGDTEAESAAEIAELKQLLKLHFAGRNAECNELICKEVELQFPALPGGGYGFRYEVRGDVEYDEVLNGSRSAPYDLTPSQQLQVLQGLCHRQGLLPLEMVLHVDGQSAPFCDDLDARSRMRDRLKLAGRAEIDRLLNKWSAWYDAGSYRIQIERRWAKSIARIDDHNLAGEICMLMEGVGAHKASAWKLHRRGVWADGLAVIEAEAAYRSDTERPIDRPTRAELLAYVNSMIGSYIPGGKVAQ